MTYEPRNEAFSFPSLQHPNHEFRLLTIYPGRQEAIIECSLAYTSLDSQLPAYEALSCTWGQATHDWMIVVNDLPFGVSENVISALRALRYQGKTRTLWVETTCVDQNNVAERSSQLQLKNQIFEKATGVIAWLGSGTIKTHETFRFIERHIESTSSPLKAEVDWDDAYGHAIMENIAVDILHRKWWQWAPAVREVAESDSIIIKCGSSTVPWDDFIALVKWLRSRSADASRLLVGRSLDSMDTIKSMYASGTRQDLSQLLLRLCMFESPDPRDKLFSALGVRERGANQYSLLDYTKSLSEVHLDVIFTCLHGDKSLDFLSLAGLGESRSVKSSWIPEMEQLQPAWRAKDILVKPSYSNLIASAPSHPQSSFDAAAGNNSGETNIGLSAGRQVLIATGIAVDLIEIVPISSLGRSTPSLLKTWEIVLSYAFGTLEPFQSLTDRWVARMSPRILNPESKKAKYVECLVDGNVEHCELRRELFRKARDTLLKGVPNYNLRRTDPHYPTPGDFQDAYYRTVLTDRTASRQRASPGYIAACMMDLETTENATAMLPADVLPNVPVEKRCAAFQEDFILAVEASLQFRTLFATQSGYIGLGPLSMQPTDVVCVLLGCSVPVVIRNEAPNCHVLVGECYMHGIMDGEVFKPGWEREVQTFNLY
jgi:Heterokaryon incompatibility protein (HET)